MTRRTISPNGAPHIVVGPMWHDGLQQNVEVIGQWLPGFMPMPEYMFANTPDDGVLIRVGTVLRLALASSLSEPRTDDD